MCKCPTCDGQNSQKSSAVLSVALKGSVTNNIGGQEGRGNDTVTYVIFGLYGLAGFFVLFVIYCVARRLKCMCMAVGGRKKKGKKTGGSNKYLQTMEM